MKKARGFTLSELMIAVLILVIAISALLLTYVTCMFMNESNNNLVTVVNDVQYVLEEIKGLAYTDIEDYPDPAPDQVKHLRPGQNEVIRVNHTHPGANIIEVTVTATWQERNGINRIFSLTTRFSR